MLETKKEIVKSIKKDMILLIVAAMTGSMALSSAGTPDNDLRKKHKTTAKNMLTLMANGLSGVIKKGFLYWRCTE